MIFTFIFTPAIAVIIKLLPLIELANNKFNNKINPNLRKRDNNFILVGYKKKEKNIKGIAVLIVILIIN